MSVSRRTHCYPRYILHLGRCLAWGFLVLMLTGCPGATTPTDNPIRLLLTPFRGKSFGTSLQAPVLIAAEVAGKVRGRMCVLIQIDHSDTSQLRLQINKGSFLASDDADLSEAAFAKYQQCSKENRPCLVGTVDSKKRELIAQVELLTPSAGGLVVAGLFQGDCTSDDSFESSNLVAREALAVGQSFRNTTEPSTPADGGAAQEANPTEPSPEE